jgi:hypothetical protein
MRCVFCAKLAVASLMNRIMFRQFFASMLPDSSTTQTML